MLMHSLLGLPSLQTIMALTPMGWNIGNMTHFDGFIKPWQQIIIMMFVKF